MAKGYRVLDTLSEPKTYIDALRDFLAEAEWARQHEKLIASLAQYIDSFQLVRNSDDQAYVVLVDHAAQLRGEDRVDLWDHLNDDDRVVGLCERLFHARYNDIRGTGQLVNPFGIDVLIPSRGNHRNGDVVVGLHIARRDPAVGGVLITDFGLLFFWHKNLKAGPQVARPLGGTRFDDGDSLPDHLVAEAEALRSVRRGRTSARRWTSRMCGVER